MVLRFLCGALLGVVAVSVVAKQPESQQKEFTGPLIAVVQGQIVEQPFFVNGRGFLQAEQQIELTAEVPGIVQELHPDLNLGGSIPAGEVLLTLDQAQLKAEVQRAQANVASAMAQGRQAQRAFERQRSLFKKNLAAQSAVDDAQAAAETATANRSQAQAALKVVEQQLADTTLKAPFDLQVAAESVSVGQYISPGQSIARVFNPALLKVEVALSSERAKPVWRYFKTQQGPVAVRLPEYPEVEALLVSAAPELTRATRTQNFKVQIPGSTRNASDLLLGEYIHVKLPASVPENVYVLPSTALRRQSFVFQVDGQRLRRVTVQVLSRNKDQFYFSSSDFAPKIPVSITKLAKEEDGLKVRVQTANE